MSPAESHVRYVDTYLKVNVSAAIEVVTQLGLWSKFEAGKTLALSEIVEATGADEIMISTCFALFTMHPRNC